MRRDNELPPHYQTISVVLPCHNEAVAVYPVLNRLAEISAAWASTSFRLREIILVDDGSSDGTRSQVERWRRENADHLAIAVEILSHSNRRGYGAALKTGIGAATGDYISFYDVDGTYDPALIPAMIQKMEQTSSAMVCGDRLSQCEHMPLTREIGNRLFVATINVLFRTRVFDSCTGMRVFSRDLREFFSSDFLPNGLDYSLAMTLTFLRSGQRLIEVPIPYSRRIGRSKLRVLTDGPRFFFRILNWWWRSPQPLVKRRTV